MEQHAPEPTAAAIFATYPQLTFLRRCLPFAILVLLAVWLVHVTGALGLPAQVQDHTDQTQVDFSIDHTLLLLPQNCVTATWALEGIAAAYFNGGGVVGHDQREVCFDGRQVMTLTIQFQDGTEKTYTLEARTFFSDNFRLALGLLVVYAVLSRTGITILLSGLKRIGLQHWSRLRWVLLALALLINGIDMLYAGSLFTVDQMIQIDATHQMLAGHGITLPVIPDTADLSHWAYSPLVHYPPGYSLLLGGLLRLTSDVWWSSQLGIWLALALFLGAWFIILETPGFNISVLARAALWLFWIFIYPPYIAAAWQRQLFHLIGYAPTDLLAFGFFSMSLAIVMRLMLDKRRFWWALIAGACMSVSLLLRYAYWPYAVVLPVSLVAYMLLNWRQRRWLIGAVMAYGLVVLLVIGGLTIYQRQASGQTTVIDVLDAAPAPLAVGDVLAQAFPFPAASLGFAAEFPTLHYQWQLPGSSQAIIWVVSGFVILAGGMLTYAALRRIWGQWAMPAPDVFFWGVGWLTIALTVAMLFYLSIKQAWLPLPIASERYFLVALPFMVVGVFTLAFAPSSELPNRFWRWWARLALVLVCFTGITVGISRGADWLVRLQNPLPELGIARLYRQPEYAGLVTPAFNDRMHPDLRVVFLRGGALADPNLEMTELIFMLDGIAPASLTDPQAPIGTSEPISVMIALADYKDDAYEQRLEQLCADHNGVIVAELYAARLCEIRLDPAAP